MKTEKHDEYAIKILSALSSLFDEESENYIDVDELTEGNNGTEFTHALANIAPTMFYNKITGEDKTNIEFNHIANILCFQFSNQAK